MTRHQIAVAKQKDARAAMAEAKKTSNPFHLFMLGFQIKHELEEAIRLDPENLEIRLDLMRFYTNAPMIVGGDIDDARAQAREIAQRDPSLGSFARGYLAYREKEYGAARLELREAVRTSRTAWSKALAMKWLGWLSQETQQYDQAFAIFAELRPLDVSSLYETGRTSVFCSCQLERGRAALEEYTRTKVNGELPSHAAAHYQLALVNEKLGKRDAAKREADIAWKLDRSIAGLKETRERLRK